MALSKKRRPVVLIAGRVIAREAKQGYTPDGRPTGEVARYDVTLFQSSHATPDVRFPRESAVRVPDDGEHVVLVVDCGETDEYGANFRVVRYATPEDIDAYAAALSAPTPAANGK